MEERTSNGMPQFVTAEYAGPCGAVACKTCGQTISGASYRVNGAPACARCTQQIKDQSPTDSHTAFVRGVCSGIVGAILGLCIYVGFALATGWIVGFVSLAVGFIVGKAISLGSGGVGGRRYQIAAVLLTYAAVSMAEVPIAISQHMNQKNAQQAPAIQSAANRPAMSSLKAVGVLTLVGLASPFLDLANPAHGVIGLIILFVGIRIAWRLTAGRSIAIIGPLDELAAP